MPHTLVGAHLVSRLNCQRSTFCIQVSAKERPWMPRPCPASAETWQESFLCLVNEGIYVSSIYACLYLHTSSFHINNNNNNNNKKKNNNNNNNNNNHHLNLTELKRFLKATTFRSNSLVWSNLGGGPSAIRSRMRASSDITRMRFGSIVRIKNRYPPEV